MYDRSETRRQPTNDVTEDILKRLINNIFDLIIN